MNYEETLNFIHSLDRFGSRPGLERIRELLECLGNPQNRCRCIHVAGTNGKGSVTMYCSHVLKTAGYHVGTYISPFVVDFRERIQYNGEYISKDDLCRIVGDLLPHYEAMKRDGKQITEFELITAAAFCFFAEKCCDVVCLEVGMGGRFDATNVIEKPLVSVICSISLDHTKILGDTVEKIAFEKCGILKKGCPAVSYPLQTDGVLAVIMEQCAQKNCKLHLPSAAAVRINDDRLFHLSFTYDGMNFTPRLLGTHQIYNAVTAVEALKCLRTQGFTLENEQIESGISETVFPARMEVLSSDPPVIVDGAHNPSGIASLCDSIRKLPQKPILVMGMLADKDYHEAVREIAPLAEKFFAVTPDNPRRLDCRTLAECAAAYTDAEAFDDPRAAIRKALNAAGHDRAVILCGSLYLASTLRPIAAEELKHHV